MIYILYGSNGVGKKTICDIIEKKFGVQIIDKYTSSLDPNLDINLQYRVDQFNMCRLNRDKHLIYSNNINYSEGTIESGILYSKVKTNPQTRADYTVHYLIRNNDIEKALGQPEKNFLLVCSDEIALKTLSNKFSDNEYQFRRILVLGKSQKENYTSKDITITNQEQFYGVIYNRYENDVTKREQFIVKQWELLTESTPSDGKIFFVKPFSSVSENNLFYRSRDGGNIKKADFVYEQINLILNKYDLHADIVQNDLPSSKYSVIDNIVRGIKNASLIIADLSDDRSNCYYELALARAYGKEIIVIINEADKKAFDEAPYEHLPYHFMGDRNPHGNNGEYVIIYDRLCFNQLPAGKKNFETLLLEYKNRIYRDIIKFRNED